MRPEVAAFRELDTLVRNLTDQLASYRKRALAAEGRTRELERTVDGLRSTLEEARTAILTAEEARDEARASAREASANERTAQALLARAVATPAGGSSVVAESSAPDDARGDAGEPPMDAPALELTNALTHEVVQENEQLRAKLGEARERTTQLVHRVRFLRQQMAQGAER